MEKEMTPFVGHWRITEMENWEKKFIDLQVPAYIEFEPDGGGKFQFVMVRGFLDCYTGIREGRPLIEFSWLGFDEMDQACGRGWAMRLEDGSLKGHIFIHDSENSSFLASRQP